MRIRGWLAARAVADAFAAEPGISWWLCEVRDRMAASNEAEGIQRLFEAQETYERVCHIPPFPSRWERIQEWWS